MDVPPAERERALDEALRLSLAVLHWLQTEAPRDDGSGHGYPGLRLLPDRHTDEKGAVISSRE